MNWAALNKALKCCIWNYGTPKLNWISRSTLLYPGKRKVVVNLTSTKLPALVFHPNSILGRV